MNMILKYSAIILVSLLLCCTNKSISINSTNTLFDYSSQQIPHEYVLVFNQFHFQFDRHELLRTILNSIKITNFDILNKTRLFTEYPSDFDVIKIYTSNDAIILSSFKHSFLKSISPHKKITRTLKATKKDSDEKVTKVLQNKNRKIFRAIPKQLIDQIDAKYMWNKGFTGKNVNVAVFDTGLEIDHPHFKNIIERIDWTGEKNANDKIGHGTFVCGVIASNKECPGIAPDVNLYIFKVFTDNQVSYTSWFLDAFNYAIAKKIDVLNLSIGGPDFMDYPFINKVWELTSSNVVMVSGIGNDGPLYGTSNNPADMNDVIGVGGINSEDQIARFSSRGMTTWELPQGYGRVKPDIVTYSTHVRGSKKSGGCRTLSGTSVASPIISGAVALLVSVFKKKPMSYEFNPANIKQILMASAKRVSNANMFEQGNGKLNLIEAYRVMKRYYPQVSFIPSYIDLTECPHFWPYCSQPLYHSALPIIFNITVLNGMDVTGHFKNRPEWHPSKATHGDYLRMKFSYSENLWPWSGYLAVEINVSSNASDFEGVVDGFIKATIESPNKNLESEVNLYVKVKIIPTPARKHRLLWDQFHNLRYPPGYFPRDNLRMKNDPLDWNGDHLHTNFKEMYQYLRNSGYFIETLGASYNCFDAKNYGALLVVDSEEEFHQTEITKLYTDVTLEGLSLIVFADWYNTSVIKAAKFYDENSRQLWTPVTGGSNIPAINDLLDKFNIKFGDRVYEGDYNIGEHTTYYASGANLIRFPKSGYVVYKNLKNQGDEFLFDFFNATSSSNPNRIIKSDNVAILGLYQTENKDNSDANPGRIVAYGDSNCLDSSHMKTDCFWLLSAVIEYAIHNNVYKLFQENSGENLDEVDEIPKRLVNLGFEKYSKFSKVGSLLECPQDNYEPIFPINKVTIQYLPSKKNYYNFVKLRDRKESAEDDPEMLTDSLDPETELPRRELQSISEDYLLKETQFPFFTSLSLVLVLGFLFYKLWKIRKRIRYKRLFNRR